MTLLGGVEKEEDNNRIEDSKVRTDKDIENKKEEYEKNKNLEEDEIAKAVKKLKIRKVSGINGIPSEAWRYMVWK